MRQFTTEAIRDAFGRDFTAALIVVVMLVPQSLAYAQLAGMPLQSGLYASVLPMIAYALFGSSTALSVGPVAVISLMTATALASVGVQDSSTYVLLAAWLALISGGVLMLAGALRLGFVANLMSHPVVAGFMTGAAILIVLGQFKTLLGMKGEGETAVQLGWSLLQHVHTVHRPTAALGLSVLLLLWLLPRLVFRVGRRARASDRALDVARRMTPVVLIVLSILLMTALDLDQSHGITVVGAIPGGLPDLGIALPSRAQLEALVLPALSIGLIGFVESVSVAQSLGMRRGERIDPNAELRGLGASNLAAGLSAGFPVAGGLSRSIVNFSAGARTRMAGVYAALLMLLVVAFLTEAFAQLAHTVLAAAIILPALGLVDIKILREAWAFSRADAWAFIGTAAGVMVLGIEVGILCGVIFSLATIQWQASNPHLAEMGRVPGTTHYRNVKRSSVVTYPHVLAIRVDGDFFFGNVRPVTAQIEQALAARSGVLHLVLDLSAVNRIDLTGLEGLRELNGSLRARRVILHLAEVKGPVLDRLERSHFLQELARSPFRFLHEAFVGLNAAH